MKKPTPKKVIDWQGTDSELCLQVTSRAETCLESYSIDPRLIEEHANIELAASEGGYGQRQLYELIQNGADALISQSGGRVQVVLTDDALYCANEGEPIDSDGVDALLYSHVSRKRGPEIGRFGLGFKSVIEITQTPRFFSRSGSFGWDARKSAERIKSVVPGANLTPRLRIAHPMNPELERQTDPVLDELMNWASTVIKLPCDPREATWLSSDIEEFPREFLLFSKHVGQLGLEVRRSISDSHQENLVRNILLKSNGNEFRLEEGEDVSRWRVFSRVHSTSDVARKDAGVMSNRHEVPIHWAMPCEGKAGPGVLWAFFPTEYETTLSGIVNAPWKTNPDRKNLLTGEFNVELLNVVAKMVVSSLNELVDEADPGALFDLFPARGREARNWADRILTDTIYQLASTECSIPDETGTLRKPEDLRIHPEGIPLHLLQAWATSPTPSGWVHWSVETRERRPRADRLISAGRGFHADYATWLEALASEGTIQASKRALTLAAACVEAELPVRSDLLAANIALSEESKLVPADPEKLFLPSGYEAFRSSTILHPQLASDQDLRRCLQVLGIRALGADAELHALLSRDPDLLKGQEWLEVWQLIRTIGYDAAFEVFTKTRTPYLRTRIGDFQPINTTLLPGRVVPSNGSRDADVLIDMAFHENDLAFLQKLGATSEPLGSKGSIEESWFERYRTKAIRDFIRDLPRGGSSPRRNLLGFTEESGFAGPIEPLRSLTDEGRAAFTAALLDSESSYKPWTVGHKTQPHAYPLIPYPSPVVWNVIEGGCFDTSLGLRDTRFCVSFELNEWRDLLPVANTSKSQAVALNLPDSLSALSDEQLKAAFVISETANPKVRACFYAALADSGAECPSRILASTNGEWLLVAPEDVTVVSDENAFHALDARAIAALLVSDHSAASSLVQRWGLMANDAKVTIEVISTPTAEPITVRDLFPQLRHKFAGELGDLQVRRCRDLTILRISDSGRESESKDLYWDALGVYWDDSLSELNLLKALSGRCGVELTNQEIDAAINGRRTAGRNAIVLAIRNADSDASRVVAAIGETAIRKKLPATLVERIDENSQTQPTSLGDVAIAIYGYDVLREFRDTLEANGLMVPATWAGSGTATAFVRELGFPREFAGFESERRPPLFEVDGPTTLNPLHDYQVKIVGEVHDLLTGENGWRGIIALPTGAGKTRVAVEALVEAISLGTITNTILWIAQSDELNEQAVQTWGEVWRAIGPNDRLSVSRLWSANEAEPVDDGPHVVVATIDKLINCIAQPHYEWLSQLGCLVVDEAHHGTAPSYTRVFDWIGSARGKGSTPILGLTATPFRGVSATETNRLVSRFGGRRLDANSLGEDPYKRLQEMGVLARVEHRVLEGSLIELTPSELSELNRLRRLPRSAEERLGLDQVRNTTLVDEVKRLKESATAILFATSVEHAQVMAAILTLEGIPARAITGGTDPGARRRYIEDFKSGKIRVLTNFSVLTQGFDAPAVEAVFVARPTYSPNLYQQMIGRGLRGPLNGGKNTCLIVNVADNVAQYGEQLAFQEFEHFWNKGSQE